MLKPHTPACRVLLFWFVRCLYLLLFEPAPARAHNNLLPACYACTRFLGFLYTCHSICFLRLHYDTPRHVPACKHANFLHATTHYLVPTLRTGYTHRFSALTYHYVSCVPPTCHWVRISLPLPAFILDVLPTSFRTAITTCVLGVCTGFRYLPPYPVLRFPRVLHTAATVPLRSAQWLRMDGIDSHYHYLYSADALYWYHLRRAFCHLHTTVFVLTLPNARILTVT